MVESVQQETKVCGMCAKDIEVGKFRLHEVACARMNYKCQKCGEIVPKSDRDQHEDDEHSDKPNVSCEQCDLFTTKDVQALARHKKDECSQRPALVAHQNQAQQLNNKAQSQSAIQQQIGCNTDLQKCMYCPMEFTAEALPDHVAYCGSKTKECPECFTAVQSWMMQAHKDTGECANIVLDRQEKDDDSQLRQAMAQSVGQAMPAPVQSDVVMPPQQVQQPVVSQPSAQVPAFDDGMDENEREIARIMQEEANGIESENLAMQYSQQQQPLAAGAMMQQNNQQAEDPSGIRAPDQSRVQSLVGPDALDDDHVDYEYAMNQNRLQQQRRINEGIVGNLGSGLAYAASSVAGGIGRLFGSGQAEQLPDQQVQPHRGDDHDQSIMTEEEKQMALAMEASMGIQPSVNNPHLLAGENVSGSNVNSQQEQNMMMPQNEDEAMARAIEASMGVSAERSSLEQIQARNDLYSRQMAQGEDEDAMLARILAESQQQQ